MEITLIIPREHVLRSNDFNHFVFVVLIIFARDLMGSNFQAAVLPNIDCGWVIFSHVSHLVFITLC